MGIGEWQPSGVWTRGSKLKLGLFSINLERGGTLSSAPGVLQMEWPRIVGVARQADEMGLEVIVSVARWRGFGGRLNYPQKSYDTLCWAAGLSAATRTINVWSTIHVPTMHPVVAAKQIATIDHISAGRAGVNIVAGWFPAELEMFGAPLLEHDRRYEQAEEWATILAHLWTSYEPLDVEGEFYRVASGVSEPKPIQKPRPALMNAGGSQRGQAFAAEYADMVFVAVADEDTAAVRRKVEEYKQFAQTQFGRALNVWTQVNIVCGDTAADAEALRRRILDHADWDAVKSRLEGAWKTAAQDGRMTKVLEEPDSFIERWIMGWAAPCIVGTPEDVAAELARYADAGLDGVLLVFPEWEDGLERFGKRVLPLLEETGLREPFSQSEVESPVAMRAL